MKPEDLEKLLTREMPYGKYAGRKIADLPGNYLGWFAREGFPKGEIGQLLALAYELDHNNLKGLLEPLRKKYGGGLLGDRSTQSPSHTTAPPSGANPGCAHAKS